MNQNVAFTPQLGTSAGRPRPGGPGHVTVRSGTAQAVADQLFTGPVLLQIPPVEDRHEYKKKSGSSDSYNTYDSIET